MPPPPLPPRAFLASGPPGSFVFIPVLIPTPSHKPKQNENSPVSKRSACSFRWQGTPDSQRYLPSSNRGGSPKVQLGKRDRAEDDWEGVMWQGLQHFHFFRKGICCRTIHLRLGRWGVTPAQQTGWQELSAADLPRKIKEQCVCFLPQL